MCPCSTWVDGKRRDTSVCDGERRETTQKVIVRRQKTKIDVNGRHTTCKDRMRHKTTERGTPKGVSLSLLNTR